MGWAYTFISLEYIPRSQFAGSYEKSMLNTFRNCQTTFQSGCTRNIRRLQILHILTITCFFLPIMIIVVVIAIVGDVRWDLIVVLIWISLRIGEVEQLFMSLLAIHTPLQECQFKSFAHSKMRFEFFYYWVARVYF